MKGGLWGVWGGGVGKVNRGTYVPSVEKVLG